MRLGRLGVALAFACCGASAAKANWEYAKWGMTPQQVASASDNQTKAGSDLHPDSDGNVSQLVASYQSGKDLFEAQFGFDPADKLASVTLVLDDKSASMEMDMDMASDMKMDHGPCRDLRTSLEVTYGRPQGGGTADMLYTIETWQDQKNSNNVKYTVLYGTGCFVQYSAIKAAAVH